MNKSFISSKKENRLNKYNIVVLLFSVFISVGIFLTIFLLPFPNIFSNIQGSCLQNIIEKLKSDEVTIFGKTTIIILVLLFVLELPCTIIVSILIGRAIILYLTYKKWYPHLLNEQAEIINSCVDSKKWKDRVAMLVPVCNDFIPNTILQTAKQTYKNIDVWIIDDSSKQEVQQKIVAFCKLHKFHLLQRDPNHKKEHPTKIGNIYYFLSKYGEKYDYVFENDSSTIVTSNFVSNALCYFKSPTINYANNIACVIANGSFYGAKNVLGYLYSKFSQFNETFCTGCGLFNTTNSSLLNGWCSMYKVSSLMQIPLEEIECTVCDAARGFWWTKRNSIVYADCYSFSAKLAPQTIVGIKNQKMKWHTGDVFIQTTVAPGKFKEKNSALVFKDMYLYIVRIMPAQYFLFIFKNIIWIILFNINNLRVLAIQMNLSILLTTLIWAIPIAVVFISLFIYCKAPIKIFIQYFLFVMLIETALYHRRIFHIVFYSLFRKKKVKKNSMAVKFVTKKSTNFGTFNWISYLKTCWSHIFIILVTTILYIFASIYWLDFESIIVLISVYFFINMPLFCYVMMYFAAWIKVKIGFDDSFKEYHFEEYDFRYPIVSKTKLWQMQNKVKK